MYISNQKFPQIAFLCPNNHKILHLPLRTPGTPLHAGVTFIHSFELKSFDTDVISQHLWAKMLILVVLAGHAGLPSLKQVYKCVTRTMKRQCWSFNCKEKKAKKTTQRLHIPFCIALVKILLQSSSCEVKRTSVSQRRKHEEVNNLHCYFAPNISPSETRGEKATRLYSQPLRSVQAWRIRAEALVDRSVSLPAVHLNYSVRHALKELVRNHISCLPGLSLCS